VLTGSKDQEIRAEVYDDDTGKALIEMVLGRDADLFNSGIRIGLIQFMGSPGGAYPTDVAIDWIRLAVIPSE
jgi:hypothetical protein